MPFPYDKYPWLNFQELNLAYFIKHFREIFQQWDQLYHDLTDWKETTDQDLADWKTATETGLQSWKTGLTTSLEAWKSQTATDISGWETATLAALDAWKTATTTVFEQIRTEAAGSASAAAASATASDTARAAAVSAQTAAEQAAADISAALTQIQTNSDDIADLKSAIDEFGFTTKTFSVAANTSHSSLADQLVINIPTGKYYKITSAGTTGQAVVYEIKSDGTYSTPSNKVPSNGSNLYKASVDIAKIGLYIASQTSAYTATFTVEVIDEPLALVSKTSRQVDGINNVLENPSATWVKGVLGADGSVNTNNNGATSDIITGVTGLMLSDDCRAVLAAYKGSAYIGKYNADGGFDTASGNWGYLTGYTDIEALLTLAGGDGVKISVIPTNGVIITADTVQAYGESNADFYGNGVNNIFSKKYINWWQSGTIASNGSNTNSTNRIRSDFIPLDGAKSFVLAFPSNCYMSYTFYADITLASFISQAPTWVTEKTSVAVPSNAKYVRFVYRLASDENITVDDYAFNTVNITLGTSIDDYIAEKENATIPQENAIIRSINHRGYNADAPENTLPAYRLSRRHGFKYVETDVAFTSDGIAVCLHDETINRTARNADGTTISETIYIKNITYAQALTYDYGIWKAPEFAGTKLPTYKEWLLLCKKLSLHPVTEIKNAGFSREQAEILANTVKSVGMENDVSFISFMPYALTYMKEYFPNAWMALAPNGAYSIELFETCISNINTLKASGNAPVVASVNYDNMTAEYYQQLSDAGVATLVWTVDQSEKLTNIDNTVVAVLSDTLRAATIIREYNVNN